MKNKYSDAGKGDKLRRNISPKACERQVYSTNACKIDKNGGPYEIDLSEIDKTTRSK